jgi:thiosulfate/3-mercaptopyruvate sulfurtransferase
LDPIGGHIPGAVCAHFAGNLGPDGRFLTPQALRERYLDLLGHPDSDEVLDDIVFYCGSGVSAAHNLLAMQYAQLGDARLYVGSWSEWITDPGRPVATGDEE